MVQVILAHKDTIIQVYSTNYCMALRSVSQHLPNDKGEQLSSEASLSTCLFA